MKKVLFSIACLFCTISLFAQPLDRSKRPPGGPAPKINLKEPISYKLPNGMTVLVVENHTLPKISASLSIDAGPVTEGKKAGTLDLLSGMLGEGTKSKTKFQFDEAVEQLGANVSLRWSGGNVSALSRYFNQAFALFAEGLQSPAFLPASFEKLKSLTITDIKASEKNVKAITPQVGNALLYGTDHPYGEMTTVATVNNVTLDDVTTAYKKFVTPSRSYLVFVGDITADAAKALVQKTFSNWKGAILTLPVLKQVNNPAKTEIDLIDFPNAVQSEIRVTNLVYIPMSNPDFFPALLANEILGGGSDARLYLDLREKHGFTYGAYSSISAGRFQRDFSATAAVRNEKTDSAIVEILNEMNRMRNEKVSASELQDAKAVYNGRFAMRLEDPGFTANLAMDILINNLPKDFYTTYLQKINAVTADDVQRVAQKYLHPSNARIIIGGKQDDLLAGLKKTGYPVKLYDKDAQPVAEPVASASAANITGSQIIAKYLNALGGEAELKKIKTVSMTGEISFHGQKLVTTIKKMAPNLESMDISMSNVSVMKQAFNGTTGYAMQGGNKKALDADEIAEKQEVKSLFEQLDYATNNSKLEVAGTSKVNGADAYKLKVTSPGGKVTTQYYDVTSGLLVKEEESRKVADQEVTTSVELKDYKKSGTVLFPQTMVQSVQTPMGPNEFVISINEIKVNEGVTAADFN